MPYTTEELLNNEYFQALVNADEKEYELKRDSAMVKADISGSGIPFEIDGVLQSYEDVRSGLGLEQPDQYVSKPMMIRNHNMDNETLDEVVDRDFTLSDKPFLKIPDGTFIKKQVTLSLTGNYRFSLYHDDMRFPIRHTSILKLYGKSEEDIIDIPDDMYDAITRGPRITGQRLRNSDALMGTHRDADFRTPLFAKPNDGDLEDVRERLKDGKSIVKELYRVTGQIAKSPQEVALLAKHLLGEPMLPTPGTIAREAEFRQIEKDFNKQMANEGVLDRDLATQKRRDLVGKDDFRKGGDDMINGARRVTGNVSRPAPTIVQGEEKDYRERFDSDLEFQGYGGDV
jgi:hypothetical protein